MCAYEQGAQKEPSTTSENTICLQKKPSIFCHIGHYLNASMSNRTVDSAWNENDSASMLAIRVCQSCTSTHYMYVSNPVLKVSNGIHVHVYVCNPALHSLCVTYFDYIIVSEVLFYQNFTWGGVYVFIKNVTSLLGRIRIVWGFTEDSAQLVNNLITGSAPLYIGGFEVLISQTPL